MEFSGRFKDISRDYFTGQYHITFEAETVNLNDVNKLKDADRLRIEVKKYRQRRSLDANSYYWVLLSRVADALNISKPHCHNLMLRRYGQIELFDGRVAYTMLPDTDETTQRMEQMEEAHFAPTGQVTMGKDGVMYRGWKLLKPSHRYDSKEMSVLIDGLIDEAKQVGVETLPPDEIARIKSWTA